MSYQSKKPFIKKWGCQWVVLTPHPYYGMSYDRCYSSWAEALQDWRWWMRKKDLL